jgi:hypothetical protein
MVTARSRCQDYFSGHSVHPGCNAILVALFAGILAIFCNLSGVATAATGPLRRSGGDYLPDTQDSKIVTVTTGGPADATLTVMTEPIEITRIDPAGKAHPIGEVDNFTPAFLGLHREQPTRIWLWNLQPTQRHDFGLLGPDMKVMMFVRLPPLHKVSYVFTFHQEGLFDFKCLEHQPDMSGQFLVLPPVGQVPPGHSVRRN